MSTETNAVIQKLTEAVNLLSERIGTLKLENKKPSEDRYLPLLTNGSKIDGPFTCTPWSTTKAGREEILFTIIGFNMLVDDVIKSGLCRDNQVALQMLQPILSVGFIKSLFRDLMGYRDCYEILMAQAAHGIITFTTVNRIREEEKNYCTHSWGFLINGCDLSKYNFDKLTPESRIYHYATVPHVLSNLQDRYAKDAHYSQYLEEVSNAVKKVSKFDVYERHEALFR